jgi:hypothetical protein
VRRPPAQPQPAVYRVADAWAVKAAPTRPASQPAGPYRYGAKPWPRNGRGTASLVFGLLGIVCFFGPGVVLGAIGVLLGISGIRRANRREATNRRVAVAGVLISVVAVLLSLGALADASQRQAACRTTGGYTQADGARCGAAR